MRVRAKISFMALEKRMTVLELFVVTIKKCYEHLMSVGAIPSISDEDKRRHYDLFKNMEYNGGEISFLLQIGKLHVDKLSKDPQDRQL